MASSRWLGFLLLPVLLAGVTGCGGLGASSTGVAASTPTPSPTPTAGTPSSAAAPKFAFWYEPWNSQITPAAVKPADVVIGLAPFNVAKAHALGKLVMQYQSYYQAIPNSLLLTNTADLPNVGFEINQQFVVNIFGTPANSYVMCPNSVIFHQRVQQYVQEAISSGYDGLFVDNTFFDPPAHRVCDGAHAHVDPTAEGGRAYLTLLSEVRQTIKAHNPKAILMTNPGDPFWADLMATGSPTVWDLSDYVLWESWGYMSYSDSRHDNWANAIPESFHYVQNNPDKVAKLVMLSYVKSVTEARFAFAAARFFGFNWTANLGASGIGTYLNSIPFSLGEPVGPLPVQDSVLHRAFEHGEVFVNASEVPQFATVPAGTLYLGATTSQTTASSQVTLPPRTAAIVIFH
jgi:hypothetical protein